MIKIPVRYVGLAETFVDAVYGSHTRFTKGKVTKTPAWAAALLLKHPEFEDARPPAERGKVITEKRVATPEERLQEQLDLDSLSRHVRLDTMSKDQIAVHVKRTYGIDMDTRDLRVDLVQQAQNIIRSRAVTA